MGGIGRQAVTYTTSHIIYPKIDSHSFCTNVIPALINAGIPDVRIKRIVGHSDGKNVTQGVCLKTADIGLVANDLAKLEYPGLDLNHLHFEG
jgi:hypothetical protein